MQLGRPTAALASMCLVVSICSIASAFTVTTSQNGAHVHWESSHVELVTALSPAPSQVSTAQANAAIDAATSTWQIALGGADLDIGRGARTTTAAPHDNDGVNMVRWALDKSDPDIEHGVLALTFVSYRASDGVIEDTDIVLNAADFTWSTAMTGCKSEYDLESALTHELGHALGLAHSVGHPEATMFATGTYCETTKRDLASDDQAGLVMLYPASAEAGGGCSASGGSGVGGLVVIAAAALFARRRRAAAAGVLALGLVGTAEASQLRHLDLADLGHDAALVVRGHVMTATTASGDAIETDSEIAVDECLAGDCPATLHVVRRGGERDGHGLWVDGEAAPTTGTEVVLYLRNDSRGRLRVLGGVQGLLHVVATSQGVFAVRDLRGQHVLVDGAWQDGGLEAVGVEALTHALALTRPARMVHSAD
jgi:MYXO-CTERM domain-containing protein